MWKRPGNDREQEFVMNQEPKLETRTEQRVEPAPARTVMSKNVATIGPSICIVGEVTGDEDLLIQGQVEGRLSLPKNKIVIGPQGTVTADVCARVIDVEGAVHGDLFGVEQVVIHSSGVVRGNVSSPRVTVEDGAKLKGTIDMDPDAKALPHSVRVSDEVMVRTVEVDGEAVESDTTAENGSYGTRAM